MIAFSSWILITGLATILSLGSQALASFTIIYNCRRPGPGSLKLPLNGSRRLCDSGRRLSARAGSAARDSGKKPAARAPQRPGTQAAREGRPAGRRCQWARRPLAPGSLGCFKLPDNAGPGWATETEGRGPAQLVTRTCHDFNFKLQRHGPGP